jgi:hypothetical protein
VSGDAPEGLPITEAVRSVVREVADVLIPAGDGMPAAREIGVADAQLDRVLAARPDLVEPLLRALSEPGPAEELLARVAADDPAAHEALCLSVAGGYYMHPDVRRLLGYDAQEPVEVRAEIIPGYVDDGLIDPVVERGARFRPAPE